MIEQSQDLGELVKQIVKEHAPADRIAARKAAEDEAKALIVSNLGNLTKEHLSQLLKFADRDFWNGQQKQGRFGLTFQGANGKSVCEQIDKVNEWINTFWTVPLEQSFDLVGRFMSEKPIRNAGYGFPSLILYLRDPYTYNVWINVMVSGIGYIKNESFVGATGNNYNKYNAAVNELRDKYQLQPQALDIVLTVISRKYASDNKKRDEHPPALMKDRGPQASQCPFTTETFALLAKLNAEPTAATYQQFKEAFHNSVEAPLQKLIHAVVEHLSDKVVAYLETEKEIFARILKNDYGRGGAWDFYWGALYPKGGKRTNDAQLFIWMNHERLETGFYIGEYGSEQKNRFLKNSKLHWEEIAPILETRVKDESITLGGDEGLDKNTGLNFAAWLKNVSPSSIRAGVSIASGKVLKRTKTELVEQISSLFEGLFPLVLLATSEDPVNDIATFIGDKVQEPDKQPIYLLADCAIETGIDFETLKRWVRAIERKGQAILYGPPGTGKTYVAERLAKHMIGGENGFVDLIQFHPSYSYEDFIQGIRPQARKDGGLDYPLVPGRFLEFCAKAKHRSGCCVLIMDEINRANISRVFGELMYLLEYRDKQIPLAGGEYFSIPNNVRLIGTMNTADRSIALVDHALRRRFAFLELYPNYSVLEKYHAGNVFSVAGLIETLKLVNQQIGDNHYKVGISFFLRADIKNDIEDIWRMEIEPYLEEYFFDQSSKVEDLRWAKVSSKILGE